MKIAVIGGGSSYTPELINGFLERVGSLPLTEREAASLHHERLPRNLYVADASLLPCSLGNPPILTIIALAKRVSALAKQALESARLDGFVEQPVKVLLVIDA